MNYLNITDRTVYDAHYRQANGRVPGAQITGNWGLDSRQLIIVKYITIYAEKLPIEILDLGCADGSLLISLRKSSLLKKGYGVDLWEEGIKWGNQYCIDHDMPITLTNGTVESYSPTPVDVAILGEILEHVPDPVECLKVARTAAPFTIITVPTGYAGKEVNTGIEEHVRQYDYKMLQAHCTSARMYIVDYENATVGGWTNLIALARRC